MLNKTELVEPTNQYKYKPDYAAASEAEIEDYLDHFSAPLVGRVAYLERTKMRNDLRHQIEQVIVAYQELGSTRAEAVAEALQQFRQAAQTPLVAIECMDSLQTNEILLQQKSRLEFALKSFGITALIEFIMVVSLARANSNSSEFNFSMLLIIALAPPAFAGAYFWI